MVAVHADEGIARAWEDAVLACWEHGGRIATQYDQADDPISRDIFLAMTVNDPFVEPRVHRAFKDGIRGLEAYRREVLEGLHDNWRDPKQGVGSYTYHQRLFEWPQPMGEQLPPRPVNQIDSLVEELVRAPHTRRALAMTWLPWADPNTPHPPCLQQIWCRVFGDRLVMNILIRSNDAWKAAFENMYAFTDLQRHIAVRLSERLGRTIVPGQYGHVAWSFHIYGSDFPDFEGFLRSIKKRPWEERTWRTDTPIFQEWLAEADVEIARSLRHEAKTGQKGIYECTCCREGG
jgi:thymidylate synthase